jgi:hypothetical protein
MTSFFNNRSTHVNGKFIFPTFYPSIWYRSVYMIISAGCAAKASLFKLSEGHKRGNKRPILRSQRPILFSRILVTVLTELTEHTYVRLKNQGLIF